MRRWVPEPVKDVLREVRSWLPAPSLPERHRFLLLTYHRVLPRSAAREAPFPELAVTPEALAAQIEALRDTYRFFTLSQAFTAWAAGEGPVAAVTFDDGYWDNCVWALPVLRALGIPATVFVVTALVGTELPLWFDEVALRLLAGRARWREAARALSALSPAAAGDLCGPGRPEAVVHRFVTRLKGWPEDRRAALLELLRRRLPTPDFASVRLLTWSEVAALREMGWEVGAHTRTHPILPLLPEGRLREEVAGARADLARRLGESPAAFAYPNGDHDARVVRAVAAAGYRVAVTTRGGPNRADTPPLLLRRVFVGPRAGRGAGGRFVAPLFRAQLARS